MAGMERIKVAKMRMALIPAAAKKRHGEYVYKRPSNRISYPSMDSDPTAGFEQHWKWLGQPAPKCGSSEPLQVVDHRRRRRGS